MAAAHPTAAATGPANAVDPAWAGLAWVDPEWVARAWAGQADPDGGMGMGAMRQFEILRGYLDVVDRYAKISTDPTTAGIAAVISAAEVLKPRGPDAAIEYFNKVLPEVKNESVARAIREQLAELYKAAGQQDKSLEQLHTLMSGAPPTESVKR